MAVLGMTKLDAVNHMLMGRGLPRVTAVDSSGTFPTMTYGTSDAGEAEFTLDLILNRELRKFWSFNTTFETLTASAGAITVGTDTMNIRAGGRHRHRTLSTRAASAGATPRLWDVNGGTNTFGTSEAVDVERAIQIAFADCPPDFKEYVTALAALHLVSTRFPHPQRIAYLAAQAQIAEATVMRLYALNPVQAQPMNTQPVAMPSGGQQGQG